jgi:T-complex protein 1 subunit eta
VPSGLGRNNRSEAAVAPAALFATRLVVPAGNVSNARQQSALTFELLILLFPCALFLEQLPASIPHIHHVVRRADTHDCGAERRWVAKLCQPSSSELTVPGTDQSQGRGQIISNINACLAVQSTIKGTLGPYGGDLLMVDENGRQTITNDGATVMKLLDIVHPAARILTDIARSQDSEVGDGTTSVVVLAGEILKEIKDYVEQGVSSQTIIKGLRRASNIAVNKVMEIAVDTAEGNKRDTLQKLAATAMSSKLIHRNSAFFTKMVVDAVLSLDQDDLNERLIGVKKITGGALQDSLFVNGVAFKKTFSYAGFEQQPKAFANPKIVCLNVELELKSEKDNAEVRVEQVSEYQAIVDAEWQIIFNKMEALYKTGAKVVLSKLPIGDLATQYFADRDVFCAGRVASDDLDRVCRATGASIQSTCSDIQPKHLGSCERFDERQIGGERFNFFEGCPEAKTCTLVLRGGAEQFIAEVERSLHDAIMIVKRAIQNRNIVAGGGACEMEVSAYLHAFADKEVRNKQQPIIKAFAKALEVIPRQLCDNAGIDATDILNRLRVEHKKGNIWAGVDFVDEGIANNMEKFVWEPSLVKINALQAATEAACLILSVDETISKTLDYHRKLTRLTKLQRTKNRNSQVLRTSLYLQVRRKGRLVGGVVAEACQGDKKGFAMWSRCRDTTNVAGRHGKVTRYDNENSESRMLNRMVLLI